LKGEKPILFDEWQEVPEIWDFIRLDIDENNHKGAYLLTGSTKKRNIKLHIQEQEELTRFTCVL